MKLPLTIALTSLAFASFGQKVNYLNANFIQVNFKDQATYYTETTKTSPEAGIVKTFFMNGVLISEESYSNLRRMRRDGLTKNFYNNGNLRTEISFKNGAFDGPLKSYYPNQRLKRAELYEKGNFVAGKCFTPAGIDTAYYAFQTEPQFAGGHDALQKYLKENSRVPITPIDNMLLKQGFSTYVMVKFVVTTAGEITDVMISKSLGTYYDKEALRLVSNMPKWTPGSQDGEKVTSELTLPIGFKI